VYVCKPTVPLTDNDSTHFYPMHASIEMEPRKSGQKEQRTDENDTLHNEIEVSLKGVKHVKRVKRIDDSIDGLRRRTREECQQEMRDWINRCDDRIFSQPEIKDGFYCVHTAAEYCVMAYADNYLERYVDLITNTFNLTLLDRDIALCRPLGCSVHILNTLTKLCHESTTKFGSTCLAVLLHCLCKSMPDTYSRLPLLERLIQGGKVPKDGPWRVQSHMTAIVTAVQHKLDFLTTKAVKNYTTYSDHNPALRPCCELFVDSKYGFTDLVRGNYFPDERTPIGGKDPLQEAMNIVETEMVSNVDAWMAGHPVSSRDIEARRIYVKRETIYAVYDDPFGRVSHR
jgi:hypothetical protein